MIKSKYAKLPMSYELKLLASKLNFSEPYPNKAYNKRSKHYHDLEDFLTDRAIDPALEARGNEGSSLRYWIKIWNKNKKPGVAFVPRIVFGALFGRDDQEIMFDRQAARAKRANKIDLKMSVSDTSRRELEQELPELPGPMWVDYLD